MSFQISVQQYALAAGVPLVVAIPGTFFQIMAASSALDVEFIQGDSSIGRALSVQQGFSVGPEDKPFQAVKLTSASNQTVQLCISRGKADLRQIVGNVSILNTGTATQTSAATGASAQVLAANSARKFLQLQNIGSVDVFYTLDGSAATTSGLKLAPGASVTYDAWTPTGAVMAYSASASTLAIVSG